MNKNDNASIQAICIQSWLRPALTPVALNRDYQLFRETLEQTEWLLRNSHAESLAIEMAVEALGENATQKQKERRAEFALSAFRMELLRNLLGLPSLRAFSCRIASSDLLADFCLLHTVEGIKRSSKSTVDRASKIFTADQLHQLNTLLVEVAAGKESKQDLGLHKPVDVSVCLMDSTCLEANIHHPVDWLFLRDVARNLLKAIELIRAEQLVKRMPESPGELSSQMNRLCIEMTHNKGKADSKKQRKKVFRKMKKQLRKIADHARRHRELLSQAPVQETRWSEHQVEQLLKRIDDHLELCPKIIKQAHQRIITERLFDNNEKILSTHEREIEVIKRGKSNKEVEFGNRLFLAESVEGMILDYKLYGKAEGTSETENLIESLERQQKMDIDEPIEVIVTDRGFDSKAAVKALEASQISNGICPKDPQELKRRMQEPEFRKNQKRRASTEARIAILKNNGGGRVCRSKGFENRSRAVGWGVLSHNLLWIVRKKRKQDDQLPQAA